MSFNLEKLILDVKSEIRRFRQIFYNRGKNILVTTV